MKDFTYMELHYMTMAVVREIDHLERMIELFSVNKSDPEDQRMSNELVEAYQSQLEPYNKLLKKLNEKRRVEE